MSLQHSDAFSMLLLMLPHQIMFDGYVFIELKHVTATVSLMVPTQTQGKATQVLPPAAGKGAGALGPCPTPPGLGGSCGGVALHDLNTHNIYITHKTQ